MIRYSDDDFFNHAQQFRNAEPFNHIILDNFLDEDVARTISEEFPAWDNEAWYSYNNAIEKKRAMNFWDRFQPKTYQFFERILSSQFTDSLRSMSGLYGLQGDYGLSGGGLHMHGNGQKLNIHLDYSIHPKLKKERRLNIILYLTPDWNPSWGGGLELWSHDAENNSPKECVKKIENVFNRALIFNTSQNSWHGLPTPINCPEGLYRKSLAAYYVTDPRQGCDPRDKVLFSPTADQANDPTVLELIKKRSSSASANEVYRR
jgi:Rps23 Pro-64 3,4-dihydroxylase Tpa1-like proline 4-hydroxylase